MNTSDIIVIISMAVVLVETIGTVISTIIINASKGSEINSIKQEKESIKNSLETMVKAKNTQIEYLTLLTPAKIVEQLEAMQKLFDRRISTAISEKDEALKELELGKGETEQLKARVDELETEVRKYVGIRITDTELSRIAAFTSGSVVLRGEVMNEIIDVPGRPLSTDWIKKEN
jgi:predicted nuclease with TOPRIM domain